LVGESYKSGKAQEPPVIERGLISIASDIETTERREERAIARALPFN